VLNRFKKQVIQTLNLPSPAITCSIWTTKLLFSWKRKFKVSLLTQEYYCVAVILQCNVSSRLQLDVRRRSALDNGHYWNHRLRHKIIHVCVVRVLEVTSVNRREANWLVVLCRADMLESFDPENIKTYQRFMIKSKRTGHAAWNGELKGTYEILVGKLKKLKGHWKTI